jgi:hypothetical protein
MKRKLEESVVEFKAKWTGAAETLNNSLRSFGEPQPRTWHALETRTG